MTISHAQAAKQAATNAVVDLIDAGSGVGKLVIKDGATVLAILTFSDPAFGNADANGTATANAITGANASDSGDADGFDATDSDDNVIFSGSVTAPGGGGDVTLDNVSIAAGQAVSITSLTYDSGEA